MVFVIYVVHCFQVKGIDRLNEVSDRLALKWHGSTATQETSNNAVAQLF
jgi:hypothetical protein